MTTAQNKTKRKAEEELRRSDNKKKTCTPKPAANPRKSIIPTEMATDGTSTERSLVDEMKKFIAEAGEASDRRVQSLFEKVNTRVEKNSCDIADIKKTIERIEACQADSERSLTCNVNTRDNNTSPKTHQAEKYSFARRSLRLWPIPGKTDDEVREGTIRFLWNKLRACETQCPDNSILRARRTRQPRKTSVNNEVLVLSLIHI